MTLELRGDEAAPVRLRDSLGATVHAELREDVLDVRADGLRAEDEIVGDLPLRLALREEAEDLLLARAERLLVGSGAGSWGREDARLSVLATLATSSAGSTGFTR